jgi:hypothetical protein
MRFRIVRREWHEHADAAHPFGLLRASHERPRGGNAGKEAEELAPLHELPSEEAYKLAHRWTIRALCIAAKYSRLCRLRV